MTVLGLLASPLVAQSPLVPLRLPAPEKRLDEEFSGVVGLRELSDGRALIADEKERRIVVADFRTGLVANVARRGSGPTEFLRPGPMWAARADTTLMPDPSETGWLVFVGDRPTERGTINSSPLIAALQARAIHGMDRSGNVVRGELMNRSPLRFGAVDSLAFVRYDRATARADTVARGRAMRRPDRNAVATRAIGVGTGSPPSATVKFSPSVREYDAVTMFPDGWIAIARFEPYRVDWCSPALRCTTGPTIETRPRYGTADRLTWVRHLSLVYGWPDTLARYSDSWPETIPPFVRALNLTNSPLLAMPDGRLLVERVPTARRGPLSYDVIDRNGMRVAQLSLPFNERVIAFGRGMLYTVVKDDVGIERVQRYRWTP